MTDLKLLFTSLLLPDNLVWIILNWSSDPFWAQAINPFKGQLAINSGQVSKTIKERRSPDRMLKSRRHQASPRGRRVRTTQSTSLTNLQTLVPLPVCKMRNNFPEDGSITQTPESRLFTQIIRNSSLGENNPANSENNSGNIVCQSKVSPFHI